ncbi:MAG: substrate-binding domain-containing protein [Deltaproteobacteria bacterium]|nr:substrate-binding domain-containing protein [Deltaproteobacteria bacterium]
MDVTSTALASIRIFSARGSAPPVRAAARLFGSENRTAIEVAVCSNACVEGACGPGHGFVQEVTGRRYDAAVAGSESDMDDLDSAGLVEPGTRRGLALREAAILVPRGMEDRIRSLEDLALPGTRIAVSTIDCLRGMWEDVCGRADLIDEVGQNVTLRVAGCMALCDAIVRGRVDAAFGWSSFACLHSRIVAVELPAELRVRRRTVGAVLRGAQDAVAAIGLVDFMASDRGRAVFLDHGWVDSRRETSCPR